MDRTNAVSIIIPIFRPQEGLLKKCLDSALNQSVSDIEIICIIDEFNPLTISQIKTITKIDNRIKILVQRHQGSGTARNLGIKNATGSYISFLDCDDFYPDNETLEHLLTSCIKNNVAIAGGKTLFLIDGKIESPSWKFKNYDTLFTNKIADITEHQICWGYSSFLFKRSFIIENDLYFPPLLRYQDPPWFIKTLNTNKLFYATDKVTYIHRDIISPKKWTSKMITDYLKGISIVLEYSAENNLVDLHTFIYRKFLTFDINFIMKKRNLLFINLDKKIDSVLSKTKSFIINSTEPSLPTFKTYKEYSNEFNSYNIIDV